MAKFYIETGEFRAILDAPAWTAAIIKVFSDLIRMNPEIVLGENISINERGFVGEHKKDREIFKDSDYLDYLDVIEQNMLSFKKLDIALKIKRKPQTIFFVPTKDVVDFVSNYM